MMSALVNSAKPSADSDAEVSDDSSYRSSTPEKSVKSKISFKSELSSPSVLNTKPMATLVVCPLSLMAQYVFRPLFLHTTHFSFSRWKSEFQRSSGGALQIHQFYGSGRGGLEEMIDDGADVIITRYCFYYHESFLRGEVTDKLMASYGTLASEYSRMNSADSSDEFNIGLHSSQ